MTDDEEFLHGILRDAERIVEKFQISGTGVAGNIHQGYTVNPPRFAAESGEGTGSGSQPPSPPATGACCVDGDCSVTTLADCETAGGDWFEGVACDPDPCGGEPTGACCVDADCSIQTEADCLAAGGTYQGDDTVCEPNPCVCVACPTEDVDSVTVILSGIVSCGCVGSGGVSKTASDLGGLNGTFVLPRISPTEFQLTGLTLTHVKTWFNDTCSGSPHDEYDDADMAISVQCSGGFWQVDIFSLAGGDSVFSSGVTASNPVANVFTCGTNPFGALFHAGQVLIQC